MLPAALRVQVWTAPAQHKIAPILGDVLESRCATVGE